MKTIRDRKILMLRPDEILPSNLHSRRNFDPQDLMRLTDSIVTSGILQPLLVRRLPSGTFELVAGERRLRAAKMAGLRRVPCVLHKADDLTAAFFSLVENLQRRNLSFFEEAEAIHALLERYPISQSEAAIRLGLAQSTLCNKLRLLRLNDELKQRIIDAGLTERHARVLLRLQEDKQPLLLDRIIAEGLTLRQTEKLVEEWLQPETQKAQERHVGPTRKMAIGDLRLFANSLSKLVDTMQSAGIPTKSHRSETAQYIEYKIRIAKINEENRDGEYEQLKIC